MTTATEIKHLHNRITQRVRNIIGYSIKITPYGRLTNWERAASNNIIRFNIVVSDDSGKQDFILRDRGGRYPAFIIKQFTDLRGIWAGWNEEWVSESNAEFGLIGASWTFFWGTEVQEQKAQILRAEWDQIERRGGIAPQPHWHVGSELMVPLPIKQVATYDMDETPVELEEINVQFDQSSLEEIFTHDVLQDIDISGMHLGMSGWKNAKQHPACWQFQIRNELNELVIWAERVLYSIIEQFGRLRIGDTII